MSIVDQVGLQEVVHLKLGEAEAADRQPALGSRQRCSPSRLGGTGVHPVGLATGRGEDAPDRMLLADIAQAPSSGWSVACGSKSTTSTR